MIGLNHELLATRGWSAGRPAILFKRIPVSSSIAEDCSTASPGNYRNTRRVWGLSYSRPDRKPSRARRVDWYDVQLFMGRTPFMLDSGGMYEDVSAVTSNTFLELLC